MAGSFTFTSQLKCQFLRDAVPGRVVPAWHSSSLSPLHRSNDKTVFLCVPLFSHGLLLVGGCPWERRDLICFVPSQVTVGTQQALQTTVE